MQRRKFIKTSGGATLSGALLSTVLPNYTSGSNIRSGPEKQTSTVRVLNNEVIIDTSTQTATISDGFLTSLKSKRSGEEYITTFDWGNAAVLQLIYRNAETVNVDERGYSSVTARQVGSNRAEIVFHGWSGDGVLNISADDATGDLIIEPSAYASRPGLLACRWSIPGIRDDLQLVAPFFQGVKLKMDDPLIRDTRWGWPISWEAGLAILQSTEGGFWIHTQDDRYRYKALKVGTKADANVLGLDTEAYGPLDNNLSAGGLCWRLNVYEGDWQVPAKRYHAWLRDAYDLRQEEERRAPWVREVKLALSWCPSDPEVLDAIAKKIDPSKVLLHVHDWRTDPYDVNYPTYEARNEAKDFLQKCRQMGFHFMPHFNAIDMDPNHPVYRLVRDFQYRDIESKRLMGWSWVEGKVLGVPESNEGRMHHRDKKVMVKIHPGLSMWRSVLAEHIDQARLENNLEAVFMDVTLVTQNLHNSLVEGTTSTEGMNRLIHQVGQLGRGLVVGGEGLNEITMQGQSFAQAHLFKSWHDSIDGLERTGGCNLNQVLFDDLCRTIGYSGLGGKDDNEALRMRLHVEHGAIPTLTIRSAREITNPNVHVKRLLDMANQG